MPYFRKASILSEIGWDHKSRFLDSNTLNGQAHQLKSDTKHMPLTLCHLTRPILPTSPEANKYAIEDIGNRVFEIYSPNRQHVCILRCQDEAQTATWFSAIHSTVTALLKQAIRDANHRLVDVLEGAQLKHMGWLYEKVSENLLA